MRNSSMKLKDKVFKRQDYLEKQYINCNKSVYIVQNENTQKRMIMKVIELGQTNNVRQAEKINKMLAVNHDNLLKPDGFCFQAVENTRISKLYLLSQRYPVSLQKIITYHRDKQEFFSIEVMWKFIMSMYNLVGKLNENNKIYSNNLKPSNIFYKNQEWCVSQFGIPSSRISKYYAKGFKSIYAKSRSIQYWHSEYKIDSENDYFSLGVIIMQMMTLLKIQDVNTLLTSSFQSQNNAQTKKAIDSYNKQMVAFAKCLLFGPKSAKTSFKMLRQSIRNDDYSTQTQRLDYSHLELSIKDQFQVYQLKNFQQKVNESKLSCSALFNIFTKQDPNLQFYVPDLKQFQKICESKFKYDGKYNNILNIWMYYQSVSQMRYITFIKNFYQTQKQNIFKNVLQLAIATYKDEKQFFSQIAPGKQYWNVQDITAFCKEYNVDLDYKQIQYIVKDITNDPKKAYLSYKDIKKLFGKQRISQSKIIENDKIKQNAKQNNNKTQSQSHQSQLFQMLSLLSKQNDGDLFKFFKEYDPKCRWINEFVIQRIIKQSIIMPESKFKKAVDQMWLVAGIPSLTKQDMKLKYIVLLKQTKKYEAVQLFKMVLTQMCNLQNFQTVFKQYKVAGKKGWSQSSLINLNENQKLEFHEREIRQVFRDLDTDGSKQISAQQLIFKLTGLKQYNQSAYIQLLREAKQDKGINLVSEFMKNDKTSNLDLTSVKQLIKAFDDMSIQISAQHAQKLYYNYEQKDRFVYMKFLRHFYSLTQLFRQSVLFILKQHHKSDFDRIFKMGLQGKSQKWSVKSIININDQLMLGFTQKQLQSIWQSIDKNGDVTLSKQEIAHIFGIKYQNNFNSSTFIQEYEDDFQQQQQNNKKIKKKISHKQQKVQRDKTFKQRLEQQIQKNEVLYQLRQKSKKREILSFFIEADKKMKFALFYNEFEETLKILGITYKLRQLKTNLQKYQFQNDGQKYINYIQIMMLIHSLEDNEAQGKAKTLSIVLDNYLKQKDIKVQKLFKSSKHRKQWNLNQLAKWFEVNIISQIYFEDLEIVWNYWGNPSSINPQQLKQILMNNGKNQNYTPKINIIPSQNEQQPKYKKEKKSFQQNRDYKFKFRQTHSQEQIQYKVQNKKNQSPPNNKRNDSKKRQIPRLPPKSPYKTKQSEVKSNKQKQQQNIFAVQLIKYGLGRIQNITKNGYIDGKQLKRCLLLHYNLDENEIKQGLRTLQKNNRVKFSDLKLFLQVQGPQQIEFHSRVQATSSQYQQSMIGISYNQIYGNKIKPRTSLIKESIHMLLIAFSQKRDLQDLQKWMFKDGEYIASNIFINKWKQITEAITSNTLQDIFEFLNPIQNLISLLSFQLAFYRQSKQTQQIQFPIELQKQLSYMFSKADTNNSRKIQKNQISGLLSSIGLNFNAKDLEIQFKNMDLDRQNSIDFNQFKLYIERNVFKNFGDFQEHIDQIIDIFNAVDLQGIGALNIDEFKNATNKMKVSLSNKQMVNLFIQIGSPQGNVQIQHIIDHLKYPQKLKKSSSRMALFKIRFGKKLTFKDIKKIFSKLSSGFVMSYSWNTMKTKKLLPSSAIRPKLDQSNLFYEDYMYSNISKVQNKLPSLERVEKYNQLSLIIRLDEATGVPIPLDNVLSRNNILRRYLSISFLDMNDEKLKFSICEIDATWDPQNQDIWSFDNDLGFDKEILVKIGDYNYETFDQIAVMFQFNITYIQSGSPIQISCGSSGLPIKQIFRLTNIIDKKLQINGGIPTRRKYFKKQDINTKRTIWKKITSLGGQVQSVLKVQIVPSQKFRQKLKYIEILPTRIICPINCIHLFYTFRQYFASGSVINSKINPLFINDNLIQTFLYSIDCRNIYNTLIPFWQRNILSKYEGNLVMLKMSLKAILKQLFIILTNNDFGFLSSYSVYSSLGDKTLHSTRNKLVKQAFQNVLLIIRNEKRKYQTQSSSYRQLKLFEQEHTKQDNVLKSLRIKNRS